MGFRFLLSRCVSRPPVRPKLEREADRLLASSGDQAAEMARIMQFRAGAGLLEENPPGFWASVARTIAHRIGIPDEAKLGTNLLVL